MHGPEHQRICPRCPSSRHPKCQARMPEVSSIGCTAGTHHAEGEPGVRGCVAALRRDVRADARRALQHAAAAASPGRRRAGLEGAAEDLLQRLDRAQGMRVRMLLAVRAACIGQSWHCCSMLPCIACAPLV